MSKSNQPGNPPLKGQKKSTPRHQSSVIPPLSDMEAALTPTSFAQGRTPTPPPPKGQEKSTPKHRISTPPPWSDTEAALILTSFAQGGTLTPGHVPSTPEQIPSTPVQMPSTPRHISSIPGQMPPTPGQVRELSPEFVRAVSVADEAGIQRKFPQTVRNTATVELKSVERSTPKVVQTVPFAKYGPAKQAEGLRSSRKRKERPDDTNASVYGLTIVDNGAQLPTQFARTEINGDNNRSNEKGPTKKLKVRRSVAVPSNGTVPSDGVDTEVVEHGTQPRATSQCLPIQPHLWTTKESYNGTREFNGTLNLYPVPGFKLPKHKILGRDYGTRLVRYTLKLRMEELRETGMVSEMYPMLPFIGGEGKYGPQIVKKINEDFELEKAKTWEEEKERRRFEKERRDEWARVYREKKRNGTWVMEHP